MPKVIDLPTSTSMSDSDYLIMEASGGGTKKITKANVDAPSSATVTLTSPATVDNNQNYLYKSGRFVQLQLWVTKAPVTVGQWSVIGTIPSGFRPWMNTFGLTLDYGTNPVATVNITQAGEIRIWGASGSSSSYRIAMVYMTA